MPNRTSNATDTLELTKALINCASVTPEDGGCQELLIKRLEAIGFEIERLPFDDVTNFWARRGKERPLLAFLGHTDVVPPGPASAWTSPPFEAVVRDGYLYGRGASDMKSGIAAMVTAVEDFVRDQPKHKGSIAFMITSDEEGVSINGVKKVVEVLESRNEKIDCCLVGEPTSVNTLGDMIKNGRRGTMGGKLLVKGTQGHIAYPHLSENPIHRFAEPLAKLCAETWDKGNEYFPPTTFQFSNINAGTGATNVIPGHLEALFNFRFCTESTPESLKKRVHEILDESKLKYELTWSLSGLPFLTPRGRLVDAAVQAIKQVTNVDSELSTTGGTSDGRFVAPTGAEVLEIGPVNATMHRIDECVAVKDLETLSAIYRNLLSNLLT
jgi:succinyl-diaminopimelate desuccinylase